jgi:hypothetical protein
MTAATSAPRTDTRQPRHPDPARPNPWRERLRLVLATVTLTLLYLAIQQAILWGVSQLARSGWTYNDPAKVYTEQAAEILKQSQTRETALSPEHPLTVYRLGVQYGYLSQWLGSYGARPEAEMRDLARPVEHNVKTMHDLAQFLGIGPIDRLPVHTAADFGQLTQRLEEDAGGVAARVEQVTSPRLRHLFMLGVHAGVEIASLASPHDIDPIPASALIGKHATLAAVPEASWRPLTRLPQGDKAARFKDYLNTAVAVERHLLPGPPSAPATRQ